MKEEIKIHQEEIDKLYARLVKEAESGGYYLNPDTSFTRELVKGLLINEKRYGYLACPCRLASGLREEDLDIICPCDYRDADLLEFGSCYCALYVSQAVLKGEKKITSIPERRPPIAERIKLKSRGEPFPWPSLPLPIWRCRVCGYLCGRESPPEVCPICKAKKDRFERFI